VTPERWKKVEEIFEAVLQRPPEDRAAFLDRVCANDITLRNQVDTLLLSIDRAGRAVESPAFGVALTDTMVGQTSPTVIGKRLGSYRIEREIGRGGMGSVYLAVRADDEYKKRVAIKLIKRGMDTDFIVRRFRNERQILASLDHPHIARLLDGGTTEDGLPYFVMEYVEGHPIYRYCDEHKLTIIERLKLFREVCAAVHYAHENLVIHRDLKPTNILVTAAGVPKLLDFGIAKLLNTDLSSQVLDPTTAAVRMMTPEYASPEQVRGETISAASDVYSLGVLLYELLTDHRPYRIKSHLPDDLVRIVCEVEPDLPSVAVNLIEVFTVEGRDPIEITPDSVSKSRSTTPEQLRRELSGSLDNIVLKAMRKEIPKRYSSVDELSADIRRYLEGHPVSAPSYFPSPIQSDIDTADPSTGGRSLAVLPFQVLRVEEKADEFLGMGLADAIITKLSNLQRIMVRPTSAVIKYFDGTHNILAAGQELNVEYVLDGRIQRAGDRLRLTVQLVRMRDGNPLWAAKFDEDFTDIFTVEDSISEQVANALVPRLTGEEREVLLRRETENSDAYRAFLKGRYFWNRFTPDDFAKALEQFTEAIRLDPDYAQAHVGIADYYNWAAIFGIGTPGENFSQAKEAATRALELDDSLAEAHAALAFTNLCYDWDWDGAEKGFKRALELNHNYGPAHQWYSNLLAAQGRFDEAITEIKRAQEINPLSLMDRSIAGWTYFHARQYLLAEQELKATLEIDRNFSNSHLMLGFIYERLGRYEESINALNRAMELMSGSVVPLSAMGYVLGTSGRRDEARAILEHLKKLGEQRYVSPYFLALIHASLADREAAFKCLERAFEQRDEWLIWLGTEPRLDYLRDDPRFAALLARVGLKEDKVHTSYAGALHSSAGHISAPHFSLTPSGPTTGRTPSLADAVNAVYKDHRKERAWILGVVAWLVLVVAAFLGYQGYKALVKPAAHFASTKIEKLTASGNVVNAAISRDGKYAAYVMDEVGKQGIWVRQMAVANSIRIVPPAETEYRGLTFANDGTYVYYVVPGINGGAGILYQVPALGGSVKEVMRGVDSPISFSPDGKQFAFIRSNPSEGEDTLMIADQNGSGEQRIATRKYPEHFSMATAPAWSPDGSNMVCVTQTADSSGFFMKLTELRLSDRTEHELVNKRWQEIGQTAWIPDGTALIITGQDASSGFLHLWRVGYPGGDLRKITNDPNDYRGVSLPASSDVLVTVQRQTLTSIFVGAKGEPGNTRPVTSGAGRFFDLIWTPEGSILYASDASGAADVWEMAADGTGQKQLTAGAGRNYAPAVTPDGRYVFFHSNRSGSWHLWRMERDGSNPVQMTKDQEESNWPDVSPDGKWVVYQHTTGGTPTVWKMPVTGGPASQVTTALSMRPAVSPDGKSIAVWQKEDKPTASWKIAVVPFEGGAATRLLDVPQSPATANSVIHWAPDGNGVHFIDFRNGVTNLMLQSFDLSPTKQLTRFTKEQFYSFDFSPDGRVLLSRGFWTNDVVLISEGR
jgi:serine/threonine protein kinase/Tol biopolymer transport system component/tetratricopeptide (TPR) repeat protein